MLEHVSLKLSMASWKMNDQAFFLEIIKEKLIKNSSKGFGFSFIHYNEKELRKNFIVESP